jgi:precorrin-3B synthase
MTAAVQFDVKGWCPGALRPIESGDGLLVRVRPRCARLSTSALAALAAAADRYGNGTIDLTRRANLQIRGASPASLAPLLACIGALGLLDDDWRREAMRNIAVNPLAGLDLSEVVDVRPIAQELEDRLLREVDPTRLPGKFAFVIDGGGVLPIADLDADVRVEARGKAKDAVMAIGLAGAAGVRWLGAVRPEQAARIAVRVARFLLQPNKAADRRARALPPAGLEALRAGLRLPGVPDVGAPGDGERHRRHGLIALGGGRHAMGFGAAFGRCESAILAALAHELSGAGASEIRLSPWRTIYACNVDRDTGARLVAAAGRMGLIVDDADPMLRVNACPGAPLCGATSLATRCDARTLSNFFAKAQFAGSLHVSGCAKGCARSAPADLALVGDGGHYRVIYRGTARDRATDTLLPCEIAVRGSDLLMAAAGGDDA